MRPIPHDRGVSFFIACTIAIHAKECAAYTTPVGLGNPSSCPTCRVQNYNIGNKRDAIQLSMSLHQPENDTYQTSVKQVMDRRSTLSALAISLMTTTATTTALPHVAKADEVLVENPVQVVVKGEVKKLFDEARVLEQQGNMAAANRIYSKVTKMAPRFIYGWSNLGNTQVAFGALQPAEESYSMSINLCLENRQEEEKFGVPRCQDLYLLYLNRGCVRMNSKQYKGALQDLEMADKLRARPDAVILQNRARARELNGLYSGADSDYSVAISMTSNEVAPFWLRSALVKYQLGDIIGAFDLIRRVENRFPEAPEVRVALATLLAAKGDQTGAQRKYLEVPDRQRFKYVDMDYVEGTIAWPPKMIDTLRKLTEAVGDDKNGKSI